MKKLSEAIRDGAQKSGWLKGGFARKSRGENDYDACALAAAYGDITGDFKGASHGGKVLELIANNYPLVKDPDCHFHRTEEEAAAKRLSEQYDGIQFPKELLKVKREVDDLPKGKNCRCKTKTDIMTEVMHRNDRGETRESIADWLESIGL